MLRSRVVIAAVLLATFSVTAFASGTAEEQDACRPDVRKLCKTVGTDEMVVLFCLKQNREKLTRSCRKVLESNGQ